MAESQETEFDQALEQAKSADQDREDEPDLEDEPGENKEENDNDARKTSGGKLSFIKTFIQGMFANKKRLILLIGILLIFLLLVIGLGVFLFSGSEPAEEKTDSIAAEQTQAEESGWKKPPVFEDILPLVPFERIVMKRGSAKGFVNMEISLHLVNPADRVQVFSKMNEIRNLIQATIRNKAWIDMKGPEGKIQCKYELLSAINRLFPEKMLKDLYITHFIML